MAAATLNLLALLTPKTNAAESGVKTDIAASANADAGREFARMIKESSTDSKPHDASFFKSRGRSTDESHAATSKPVDRDRGFSRSEWKHVDREITPREASKALKAIETREASGTLDTDLDPKVVADVKVKLQAIVDSGKPAKISDVLAAVTGEDPKTFLTLFANANNDATEEVTALAGAVKKVLSFIDKALCSKGKCEGKGDTDTADTKDTTTSTADAALTAQISAMANQTVVPQVAEKSEVNVATAAPVETIDAISDTTKRVAIDTLIPTLTLSADEKRKPLPDVELPKMDVAELSTKAETKADLQAPAPTTLPPAIERQLQALNDNRQFFAAGLVKDDSANAPKTAANSNTQVTALSGVQGASASGNLTGTAAVTAASTIAGNLINHAPVREQVHVAISKAAKEGIEQVTIALDPQGLGRVEVKMHTGRDGQTQISFLVDKPETFDALSRDARGLERALQDSGVKADSGSMQFNLRQQSQQADSGSDRQPNQQHSALVREEATVTAQTAPVRTYRVGIQDGIDIHA